jgi:hypothetical protein
MRYEIPIQQIKDDADAFYLNIFCIISGLLFQEANMILWPGVLDEPVHLAGALTPCPGRLEDDSGAMGEPGLRPWPLLWYLGAAEPARI